VGSAARLSRALGGGDAGAANGADEEAVVLEAAAVLAEAAAAVADTDQPEAGSPAGDEVSPSLLEGGGLGASGRAVDSAERDPRGLGGGSGRPRLCAGRSTACRAAKPAGRSKTRLAVGGIARAGPERAAAGAERMRDGGASERCGALGVIFMTPANRKRGATRRARQFTHMRSGGRARCTSRWAGPRSRCIRRGAAESAQT